MYKKVTKGWLKHLDFILLDLVIWQLAFLTAFFCKYESFLLYQVPIYKNLMFVMVLVDIFVVFFFQSYKNILKRKPFKEFCAVGKHTVLVMLITIFYLFVVQKSMEYSRFILIVAGVLFFVLSFGLHLFWKRFIIPRFFSSFNNRSILLITLHDLADELFFNLSSSSFSPTFSFAILDNNSLKSIHNSPIVASDLSSLKNFLCRNWVDEVFIHLPYDFISSSDIISSCLEMGLTVHTNLFELNSSLGQKHFLQRFGSYYVVSSSLNIVSSPFLIAKRLLDIIGSLFGCLLTGILFIFLAPCIYIKSPGPIFFSQTRVGKNGKPFKIYKFRSMYLDAEHRKKDLLQHNLVQNQLMFKMEQDPRIIPGIGSFIRKFSLDEFPQFFNVLKGDMSLVGTRPPTLDEWNLYLPHHRARLATKPGLTGLWQVSGRNHITDFEQVVSLDMDYITNWSFLLDIRILLKTCKVVFFYHDSL